MKYWQTVIFSSFKITIELNKLWFSQNIIQPTLTKQNVFQLIDFFIASTFIALKGAEHRKAKAWKRDSMKK